MEPPAGPERLDLTAAMRGGDPEHGMDGEADPRVASLREAVYWRKVYSEILAMEETILRHMRELMTHQSVEVQREAELTNVPVIAAQVEKFRRRLEYWTARVSEFEPQSPS